MFKTILTILIAGSCGLAAGTLIDAGGDSRQVSLPSADYLPLVDPTLTPEERIKALETIVIGERNARLVLEEQIILLLEEVDRIDSRGPQVLESEVAAFIGERQRSAEERAARISMTNAQRNRSQSNRQRRHAQLVEAGIAVERADWLVKRTSELLLEQMQTEYLAQHGEDPSASSADANARLRDEIGDAEFERALRAIGLPAAVPVQTVYSSSPAAAAGLRSGDEIVSYGGKRLFDLADLHGEILNIPPGRQVTVVVRRDGEHMQMLMPSGPLGIGAGRSSGDLALYLSN